jgi:orotidine-5'-phosphate decarboxylase
MTELIVALDLASADEALRLADRLPDLRWVKVGPVLFVREGPGMIRALQERGLQVFLDLKWLDIPNTVAGAVHAAEHLRVDLATVHAAGGAPMLRAAVEASSSLRLAAVTVLTSHRPESYREAMGRGEGVDLEVEVGRLVRLAVDAGVGAIVTSPLELARVRDLVDPETWLVVPGIRPAGVALDDQRRTLDPRKAAQAGATHLVVGRPITRANDPQSVYNRICEAVSR